MPARSAALRTVLLCGVAPLLVSPSLAQPGLDIDAKVSRATRTASPPTIDGVLDDAAWADATPIVDFHQVEPVEFESPTERMEVYVLYDSDSLFIAARLYDREPERINARVLRQNQPIGSDDRFFVHIDTFNNRRSGYLFGVNPNGVRYDGVFENMTERTFDWDGIWQAAASIDAEGWVAEIAIPFKTLSFDPSSDTWRMNFARNIVRRNESSAWVSRDRNTDLSTMGRIVGITEIAQGRGLDVVPSVSLRERKDLLAGTTTTDSEPALDIFYKVTPSLNAALTVNTDFSATEVDDRQVNLTRFNLFFPERRDFFLQDLDIFQFGRLDRNARPFFSRSIGIGPQGQEIPIDVGGKLSGRVGRFDVGAVVVQQDQFEDIDAATVFVGRVAANVLDQSSVGMIATDGDPASNLENSVFGVDFRYANSRFANGRGLEGEAWALQSDSEGLIGRDSAFGAGFRLPSSAGLRGGMRYKHIEENYNPALGYVDRVGVDNLEADIGHTWRPRRSRIREIYSGLSAISFRYLDNGDVQTELVNLQLVDINTSTRDGINARYSFNKEGLRDPFEISPGVTIPPGLYSFEDYQVGFNTGNQRVMNGGLFYTGGGFYDGQRQGISGFLGWRPSVHFRGSLNFSYNDISLPAGSFITRLIRLNLEGIFSSTLAWTNSIQYDNVSETIGINSRLHWIPEAGREGFIVLNHGLEDFDRDNRFHSSNAEVAIKFGYTFRF